MVTQQTTKAKGNELEAAVQAIEEAILRLAPGFSDGIFKFESNKIINDDGVHHEIDIYVTASPSAGYESVFIFECKNWTAKVGKNEIIIFAEKISISGAQRGFFVAKEFTKDAITQADKNNRIQLLTADHFEPLSRTIFPQCHLLDNISSSFKSKIIRYTKNYNNIQIDLDKDSFLCYGNTLPARFFLNDLCTKARDIKLSKTPTQTLPEGRNTIPFNHSFSFLLGSLILKGEMIYQIEIDGQAIIETTISSLQSIYDVKTRGRMVTVGASNRGMEMTMEFVELPNDKPAPS